MSISAKIIKDSTNWLNKRLTTFVLEYPRYIHAELATHRVFSHYDNRFFSKNSASSRAIPTAKMIETIIENGVVPMWTINKAGMQGEEVEDDKKIQEATNIWNQIKKYVIDGVKILNDLGIHKQNANRPLEAFQHIKIILTGTEFDNFFVLRDHEAAMPEIRELAKAMKKEFDQSVPEYLEPGQWHIPFGGAFEGELSIENQLKISVARCARISYNNFEGNNDIQKDFELYKRLIESEPLHASPAEHQAQVPTEDNLMTSSMDVVWFKNKETGEWNQQRGKYFSNLQGWIQYRKIIENYGKD